MFHIEQITPQLTWRLRHEVLYPDMPLNQMRMEEDDEGYHFGAFDENKIIGVVSLFSKDKDFQFRKLAVNATKQGLGVGKALLDYVISFAKNENTERIWCNARLSAIGFYLKAGFKQTGEAFSRGGIDYEIMEKTFQK